jgi:hypothetical protein
MQHALAVLAAGPVPAYCGNLIKTPAQWKACWDAGWSQPTTGAANAGFAAGHSVAPWAVLAGIIIGLLWLASRSRSGSPAASKS